MIGFDWAWDYAMVLRLGSTKRHVQSRTITYNHAQTRTDTYRHVQWRTVTHSHAQSRTVTYNHAEVGTGKTRHVHVPTRALKYTIKQPPTYSPTRSLSRSTSSGLVRSVGGTCWRSVACCRRRRGCLVRRLERPGLGSPLWRTRSAVPVTHDLSDARHASRIRTPTELWRLRRSASVQERSSRTVCTGRPCRKH